MNSRYEPQIQHCYDDNDKKTLRQATQTTYLNKTPVVPLGRVGRVG